MIIENKNEINIEHNAMKIEKTADFLKINQNPTNDVDIICIQPLHPRERLKR